MDLIELDVLGITYGPIKQNAYALLLKERYGNRRIPVVIGSSEAQSIALKLEGVIPPRPMAHELMTTMMHAFSIQLQQVVIYGFADGVFLCSMQFVDDTGREVALEARVSDAIAMALRTDAPIYAEPDVLKIAGFEMPAESEDVKEKQKIPRKLEDLTNAQLEKLKQNAIKREYYEKAADIQRILKERASKEE